MRRLRFKTGMLLLALGAVVGVYCSDTLLFVWPDRLASSGQREIGRHLRRRHDMAFLMTFDEPGAFEWISGRQGLAPRVEAVPGRTGWSRSFSGTRWSAVHTPGRWITVGSNHTISIRIKLRPPSDTQDILFCRQGGRSAGLKLEYGNLAFFIPSSTGSESISYPFTRWNERVHITAVADADAGLARLYENGRLMAEGPFTEVEFPDHNIEFGARRWYDMRDPLDAVVDEAAIWNRALTDSEIRRLYRSRRSALDRLVPFYYRLWRGLAATAQGIQRGLRYIDYFDPRIFHGHARTADIPEFHLVMPNRYARHYNHAHFRSGLSGRRTRRGARFQPVDFLYNGRASSGKLALDGRDIGYGASPRRSFLLEADADAMGGMGRVRLTPPEDMGWIVPLLDTRIARDLNVPATRNGLCRLFINGRFEGIYYYEDDTRRGMDPHTAGAFLRGPEHPGHWPFLFELPFQDTIAPRGPPRTDVPLSLERLQELFDELADEVFPLFINDVMAPFGRRELKYRLRDLRQQLHEIWTPAPGAATAENVAAYLTPFLVLGGNPAPLYIREDLDLNVFPGDGLSITWSSSNPEVLGSDGRVRLPDDDRPVAVTLTARVDDGTTSADRTLDFRVMPRTPRVPALMIYVNDALSKSRRVDCRIERYTDNPFEPVRYRAFQAARSGIKFRGNTSFWQLHHRPEGEDPAVRKMSFSIRFEEPHGLLNDTTTRHLYLANGYIDIALLRNKLSYDLFKAMSGPGAPRYAPDIEWMEVFINGRYQGVYEAGTRVDRHMLGWDRSEPDEPDPPVLYKFQGRGDNFSRPNVEAISQKRPPREHGLYWDPYLRLVDVVRRAPADTFVEQIERLVDVDAVIDWHLLLNFTENRDGINVNLYLARDRGPETPAFIIPWDYDKTFAHRAHQWYSNGLTSRLWRDHPDYRRRMAERWRQLRADVWSEAAILERIDLVERHLEGYVEWDHEQWDARYARGRTLAEVVDSTRSRALDRLAYLDQFFEDRWPAEEEADFFVEQDEGNEDDF